MKWPWSKPEPEPARGAAALEDAERRLSEAVMRWPEVRQVSRETRRHLERNHFADAITAIWRGQS